MSCFGSVVYRLVIDSMFGSVMKCGILSVMLWFMFCVCNVLLSVWWLCLIDFMLMCVVCMNWLRFSVVVVGSLCWCFVMYM